MHCLILQETFAMRTILVVVAVYFTQIAYSSKNATHFPILTKSVLFDNIPTSIIYDVDRLRRKFGGDLPTAVYDVVDGFPISELAIAFDNHTGEEEYLRKKNDTAINFCADFEVVDLLAQKLRLHNVTTYLYNVTTLEVQEVVSTYINDTLLC